jgi:predicted ester cyclase
VTGHRFGNIGTIGCPALPAACGGVSEALTRSDDAWILHSGPIRARYRAITEGSESVTISKELCRRWIDEAWSKGNVDVLDDLNTPDFVDHSGLPGVSPDTAGMKQFIAGLHAAFSEVVITIEDMVAEGDRLVGRWVMRGVNTGSFNGMPATGRPVTLVGFDLLRVEGDRFAEVWAVADIAGMLQQLGAMPGPPSA